MKRMDDVLSGVFSAPNPHKAIRVTRSMLLGLIISMTVFFGWPDSHGRLVAASAASLIPMEQSEQGIEECLRSLLTTAPPDMTVGELRQRCTRQYGQETEVNAHSQDTSQEVSINTGAGGAIQERIRQDDKNVLQPFTLMAHRPNYILFAAYNRQGYNAKLFNEQYGQNDIDLDHLEAQFQLSIKFPLLVDLFDGTMDVYAAYTNRSFWQYYNSEISSPFRETNHEPELWVQFQPNWQFFGFTNTWNSFGINHQSNGQGGVLSRSWNRVFAWITFERDNLAFSIKPWLRLEEDYGSDDNPDITDYLGHGEFSAAYAWDKHVFSLMSRNNLESGFSKGAIELSWSFPLWDWPYLRGYLQYFGGYGESLIDYNHYTNRIGLGFSLTDWL